MRKVLRNIANFYSSNNIDVTGIEEQNVTVEEIHNQFDNAANEAVKEATKILADQEDADIEEKAILMQKIGMSNNPIVHLKQGYSEKIAKAKSRIQIVKAYELAYPHFKIIFPEQVDKICKKYGLIHAPISWYKGEVPIKNLREVANFQIAKSNIHYMDSYYYSDAQSAMEIMPNYKNQTLLTLLTHTSTVDPYMRIEDKLVTVVEQGEKYNYGSTTYRRPNFEICAPEKDIIIPKDRKLFKGKRFVFSAPDPVVLFPQKGCYIVVSKWGLEASDPLVVNEKMN